MSYHGLCALKLCNVQLCLFLVLLVISWIYDNTITCHNGTAVVFKHYNRSSCRHRKWILDPVIVNVSKCIQTYHFGGQI